MASMGVLASLMQSMTPDMPRYNPMEEAQQQALLQGRRSGNETALLTLSDLKAKQQAEQLMLEAIKNDPALAQQLLGGSVLGSLGQGAAVPPGGALTQQVMPGQPPGAPQMVPGGQDLSQFATQGQPQSTIASLGPAGQPQMQGPRNPVLEMAQRDPRAAMMLSQQMQQSQDMQLKRQEQQLTMGTKVMEYVGRVAQGVTDQASLDAARQELARVHPQAAAQLPQGYSKEAMAPFIAKALDVKDSMLQRLEASKIDALLRGQDVELAKAQQTGGKVNYQTDAQGNIVVVPEYAPGGGPVQSRPVLGADGQPIKSLEGQKLTTQQQEQVRGTETGLRTQLQARMAPFYEVRDAIGRIEQSATAPTATGDIALITSFMKMIDPTTGVKDAEFRNAAGAGGILDRIQGYIGKAKEGTRLDDDVRADFLQRSRMLFEQYSKDYGQVRQQFRDLTSRMGGKPENVDLEMGSTVVKPPGGGAGGWQGGNTFTDADITATLVNPANKGKTRQQVIDAALAKGLTYKER